MFKFKYRSIRFFCGIFSNLLLIRLVFLCINSKYTKRETTSYFNMSRLTLSQLVLLFEHVLPYMNMFLYPLNNRSNTKYFLLDLWSFYIIIFCTLDTVTMLWKWKQLLSMTQKLMNSLSTHQHP